MADYRITGERLTGIADQARRLAGVIGEMTPEHIERTLEQVKPGGELQEKTVTPSAEVQVVVPDAGYYGLGKVTVGAASGTVLPENVEIYYVGKVTVSISNFTFDSKAIPTDYVEA